MWLMWSPVSVLSVMVLVLEQDRCTVCTKRNIGLEIGRTRWYSKLTRLKWKLVSVHLEIVLILSQDSCTVCMEHTIGSEIILDVPDGTPRRRGSCQILFRSIWRRY
jgi:hypothetical protein